MYWWIWKTVMFCVLMLNGEPPKILKMSIYRRENSGQSLHEGKAMVYAWYNKANPVDRVIYCNHMSPYTVGTDSSSFFFLLQPTMNTRWCFESSLRGFKPPSHQFLKTHPICNRIADNMETTFLPTMRQVILSSIYNCMNNNNWCRAI